MCVLKITVRIWHFWCLRERATSFHLCHTEAETHGSHLQLRLADLGLHSFVFCQDLSLIFPTLPSPASFARHSNLVSYCGHYWGTAMVRRWLDFMIHCRLLGCENFFKRSSEFYRLRKKSFWGSTFVLWEVFDPKEKQMEECGSCTSPLSCWPGPIQCLPCRGKKKVKTLRQRV